MQVAEHACQPSTYHDTFKFVKQPDSLGKIQGQLQFLQQVQIYWPQRQPLGVRLWFRLHASVVGNARRYDKVFSETERKMFLFAKKWVNMKWNMSFKKVLRLNTSENVGSNIFSRPPAHFQLHAISCHISVQELYVQCQDPPLYRFEPDRHSFKSAKWTAALGSESKPTFDAYSRLDIPQSKQANAVSTLRIA